MAWWPVTARRPAMALRPDGPKARDAPMAREMARRTDGPKAHYGPWWPYALGNSQ